MIEVTLARSVHELPGLKCPRIARSLTRCIRQCDRLGRRPSRANPLCLWSETRKGGAALAPPHPRTASTPCAPRVSLPVLVGGRRPRCSPTLLCRTSALSYQHGARCSGKEAVAPAGSTSAEPWEGHSLRGTLDSEQARATAGTPVHASEYERGGGRHGRRRERHRRRQERHRSQ